MNWYGAFGALCAGLILPLPVTVHAALTVSPANTNVQYAGRVDLTNPQIPLLLYSGSSMTIRFSGSTSVSATLKDDAWGGGNYLYCIVDSTSFTTVHLNNNATQTVSLVSGLSTGAHTLVVYKKWGVQQGSVACSAILLDDGAAVLPLPLRKSRRIEFFGNSVTEGNNAECRLPQDCNDAGDQTPYHNNYFAYGSIVARGLNAEHHNEAIAGQAVRNGTGYFQTCGGWEQTYDKMETHSEYGFVPTTWNFTRWVPHLVVVGYGINDQLTGALADDALKNQWKTTYKAVLNKLTSAYPRATFILTVPNFGGAGVVRPLLQQIVSETGLSRVHYFEFTNESMTYHPNKQQHEAMAVLMRHYIDSLSSRGDIRWDDQTGSSGAPDAVRVSTGAYQSVPTAQYRLDGVLLAGACSMKRHEALRTCRRQGIGVVRHGGERSPLGVVVRYEDR